MVMAPAKPGSVCWRDKNGECRNTTDVWQVPGTQAAHVLARMATDVDGSPRAYHPSDQW